MHYMDIVVVVAYFAASFLIGIIASRSVKTTKDMNESKRSSGKIVSAIFNFGAGTSEAAPVGTSRETFRNGASGIWFGLAIFIIPAAWIFSSWYRRLRVATQADFFLERFRSNKLGVAYAVFAILITVLTGSIHYTAVAKTTEALFPKPKAEYTAEDKRSTELFREYKTLETAYRGDRLDPEGVKRYFALKDFADKKEILPQIPVVNPQIFVYVVAIVNLAYTFMGGLVSSVATNMLQGNMIILFSLILLPVGFMSVGGFTGLHLQVPETFFPLTGTTFATDWTLGWMLLMQLLGWFSFGNRPSNIVVAGGVSKDEHTARVSTVTGSYIKQVLILSWALLGLLGLALFKNDVSDPDNLLGVMSQKLLGPGFCGLLFSCLLAALMSTISVELTVGAATITSNIIKPFLPNHPDHFFLWLNRLFMVVLTAGSVLVAVAMANVFEIMMYVMSVGMIFGIPMTLSVINRRVNSRGVWASIFTGGLLIVVLPLVMGKMDCFNCSETGLMETKPHSLMVSVAADSADVAAGKATRIGELVKKPFQPSPCLIFFSKKERIDPFNPDAGYRGVGGFNTSLYILHRAGVDLQGKGRGTLRTYDFAFQLLFTLFIVFLFSYLTRPKDESHVDRFFLKFNTPVLGTPEADRDALEQAYRNPEIVLSKKLFRKSSWELYKPSAYAVKGFIICWIISIVMLFGIVWLFSIGSQT